MPPSRGGRDRFKGAIRRDRQSGKRYPNSIVALIRTICTHWSRENGRAQPGARKSVKSFVETSGFDDVLFDVFDRFPRAKKVSTIAKATELESRRKGIKNMLESFGSSQNEKPPAFEYHHLRAFSDYLGITEAGFLFVTKLLSLERRVNDLEARKRAMSQMIEAHRRMIDEAERLIESASFTGFAVSEGPDPKDKTREVWIADPASVELLVREFLDGDLSDYDDAMNRP